MVRNLGADQWQERLTAMCASILAVGLIFGFVGSQPAIAAPAPSGTYFTANGARVPGFDPAKGGAPLNGSINSATWNVSGTMKLHNLPAGWTVDADMSPHPISGKNSAFYIIKGNGYAYRWWFTGATGITRTIEELRGITLTHNGRTVPGIDPTKDATIHNGRRGDMYGYDGLPVGWVMVSGENERSHFYRAHPENANTPSVAYTFMYDAPTGLEGMENITAWLDDGTPVTGFKPKTKGGYIPYGHDAVLANLPAGWSARKDTTINKSDRIGYIVTTATGRKIDFMFFRIYDYIWTYEVQFDTVGGTSVPVQYIIDGGTAKTPSAPSRMGYVFQGWYTAATGGSHYDFSQPITSNTVLYAHWVKGTENASFRDVNESTPHAADISWLVDAGISTGWQEKDGSYTYRGMSAVKRQDMAAFLYRLAGSPTFDTTKARNPFRDVGPNTPHYKEILWLYSTGISTGWREKDGSTTFRGMNSVVRQDMAAFLHRLADYEKANPTLGSGAAFADVTSDTPHTEDIAWLAKTGVTTGWIEQDGSTTFRGMSTVKRQDMAAFLHRMSVNVLKK